MQRDSLPPPHSARERSPSPPPAIAFDQLSPADPSAVPFSRILPILRRRFWIIAVALAVGLGGSVAVVGQMQRRYSAQTAIIIEPQRTQVSDLQAISTEGEDIASLMRTQIDVLSSPSLALGVVRALHLVNVPEFKPNAGGLMASVKGWLIKHGILRQPPSRPLSLEDREVIASGILSTKIGFTNDPHSRLLGIAATTLDPKLSAAIANEFARQFLAFKVQEKFAAMQRAHDWLQGQVTSLAEQVRRKDAAVEEYRQRFGLAESSPISFDGGGPQPEETVNRQQLNATSTELVLVSRDLAEKESALAQAKAVAAGRMSPTDLPAVLTSQLVGGLVQESAAASAHAAELASQLGSANPELHAATANAETLWRRTRSAIAEVVRNLNVQVSAARAQKMMLQGELNSLRAAVSDENAAQLGLNTLESQARATRNLYESFLTRAAQLANVAGIQEPDASLVSRAEPPLGPSSPKSMRVVAVAGLLSLAIGVGIAVVLARLQRGFSSPEEIESSCGIPLLAMLPTVEVKPGGRHDHGRAAIAMEAGLDRLRGQMRILGEARPQLLMVTSSLPREGKSVLSAKLAQNTAAAGWRVLLLECDFRRPALARFFGLSPGAGLCEILSGLSIGSGDRVIRRPAPNLDVILAGGLHKDGQELLASPRMQALLADSRSRYDLVIMDTPPVLPVADALVLGQIIDACLTVVQWEKTPRDAVMNAIRVLRDSQVPLLGLVMTQVNQRRAIQTGGRIAYSLRHYASYHHRRA